MSNLPGNPHAGLHGDDASTGDGRVIGEALLALAYEQRTANLIALHQMTVTAILSGAKVSATELLERNSEEIEKRLGILETLRPGEGGE